MSLDIRALAMALTHGGAGGQNYREALAQTNLLSLQEDNLQTQIYTLGAALVQLYSRLKLPVYNFQSGLGVVMLEDADEGPIQYIAVDPALAGQTLYVQLSNSSGMTETRSEVNVSGFAVPALSTVSGQNLLYVTTLAYAFPPTENGGHGKLTDGVYVNLHTDENGLESYDSISLANGVYAAVRYRLDFDRRIDTLSEISEGRVLAALGKGVNYVVTDNPQREMLSGRPLYMKKEGYPFGTLENPAYVKTGYPNPDCRVFYVAEYYSLT